MRSRADQSWQELSDTLLAGHATAPLSLAVLAAHPDDEAIAASVPLHLWADPQVIYLTDGAPHDSSLWSSGFKGSRQEYASLRRVEAERALSRVDVSARQMHWLGAVDQEAVFSAPELANRLAELLSRLHTQVLITHPYEGGHPDHDAAALVARLALGQMRSELPPLLVEMTSYHARQGQCVTGEFLETEPERELSIQLNEVQRERKQKMFAAYTSQRQVLNSFGEDYERFRKAPDYDFARPPHEGKLWYECMGWKLTGQHWRAIAAQAIAETREVACR